VSCAADNAAAVNITSLFLRPHFFGRDRRVMRPVSLKIGTGDFALAAGHRRNATGLLIERSSSGARCLRIIGFKSCTAMLAGLPTLI
jgi:hypothetical protein